MRMDGVAWYRPEHAMAPFLVVFFFFRVMELKYAKDQGLCTALCYVVFMTAKSMIGDAIRIQRTPRSMPAACSLTRTWCKHNTSNDPFFAMQKCAIIG